MLTTIRRHRTSRTEYEDTRSRLKLGLEFKDCLYHFGRTLDEAYYPGLGREALETRNKDQIVSRSGDDFDCYSNAKEPSLDAPILIVPQLWVWRVADILISAHSLMPPNDVFATESTLVDRKIVDADIEARIGLLMANSIDQFGMRYSHEGVEHLPALDMLEKRVVGIMSEVSDYIGTGKSKGITFDKERYFSHIMSDIRSELAMIQYFLSQQDDILSALRSDRSEYELTAEQHKDDFIVNLEADRKRSSELSGLASGKRRQHSKSTRKE